MGESSTHPGGKLEMRHLTDAEIIEAIEGPVAITDCSSAEGCPRNCPVSPSWQKVNARIFGALDGLTLADIAAG